MTPPRLVFAHVALPLITTGLLLFGACKEAPQEAPPDASVRSLVIDLPELGLSISLAGGWIAVDVPKSFDPIRTVARARKEPANGRTYLAVPRLEITREPTPEVDPQSAFRRVMDELKSVGDRPGVRIVRTALSSRPVGDTLAGDLELVYEATSEDGTSRRDIVHRSLLVVREIEGEGSIIVSITATHMASDADLVGTEIRRMFSTLELRRPGVPLPGPTGE